VETHQNMTSTLMWWKSHSWIGQQLFNMISPIDSDVSCKGTFTAILGQMGLVFVLCFQVLKIELPHKRCYLEPNYPNIRRIEE